MNIVDSPDIAIGGRRKDAQRGMFRAEIRIVCTKR